MTEIQNPRPMHDVLAANAVRNELTRVIGSVLDGTSLTEDDEVIGALADAVTRAHTVAWERDVNSAGVPVRWAVLRETQWEVDPEPPNRLESLTEIAQSVGTDGTSAAAFAMGVQEGRNTAETIAGEIVAGAVKRAVGGVVRDAYQAINHLTDITVHGDVGRAHALRAIVQVAARHGFVMAGDDGMDEVRAEVDGMRVTLTVQPGSGVEQRIGMRAKLGEEVNFSVTVNDGEGNPVAQFPASIVVQP